MFSKQYSLPLFALILCLYCCQSKDNNNSQKDGSLLSNEPIQDTIQLDTSYNEHSNYEDLSNWASNTDSIIHSMDSIITQTKAVLSDSATWYFGETAEGLNYLKKISIDSTYGYKVTFLELYIEKNGELKYALESTEARDSSYKLIDYWNCMYELRNNNVYNFISLGHGETETDDWSEQSIFNQWEECRNEFDSL